VPFQGLEPSDQDLNTTVLAKFSAADLLGALVLRALPSQAARAPNDLSKLAEAIAERYRRTDSRLAAVTEAFPQWYARAYGAEPWSDPQLLRRATPCSPGLAGEVIKAVTASRNQHILSLMTEVFPRSHAVSVVVGSGHYRVLAPALKARFGSPTYSTL
jgi:hypothetical protein